METPSHPIRDIKSSITLEDEEARQRGPSLNVAKPLGWALSMIALLGAAVVIGVLVWQGITAEGAPDPTQGHASPWAVIMDIAVLVFREGLECILVLSAITVSLVREKRRHRRPVAAGAGVGAIATIITWFIVVGIVHDLSNNFDALQVQAWTGLLAVVVLLIVMNWFFHNIYWGGWISMHHRKKKELLADEKSAEISQAKLIWGMGLLGFASFYREGFEVVLFLQSYNLKLGGRTVLFGTLLGLFLTGIVAALTFIAGRKLPYRKMLELTGVLLGGVLLVMVGEQAQEMQLAGWLHTTTIPWLADRLPAWLGLWFSIFPTVETLAAQLLAAALVAGSFFLAKRTRGKGDSGGDAAGSGVSPLAPSVE